MNRPKDSTPLMTERHWHAYQTALGTVLKWAPIAPHATAPWDREENHDRRPK